MLSFTCACGHALKVSNDLAGWTTKCPGCKQLIPVPSPDEPAPLEVERRAAASIPWKGIAIGASSVAVLAILIAVASMGKSAPDPETVAENDRLKRQVSTLDREVDELRAKTAQAGEAARLGERLKTAEADRDRLRRELDGALRQVAESRAATSTPANPAETRAPADKPAPAAPTPAATSGEAPPAIAGQIPDLYSGAIVLVETDRDSGGGFFISKDGLIVTSYRAIAQSEVRKVTYIVSREGVERGRMTLKAQIVAIDRKNDLALIQVATPHLVPAVTLEEQFALGGGQELTILGTPLADSESVDINVMRGKVVDIWAPAQGKPFIKTTIPVTSRVAGVPVFNVMGRVVGVARVAPTVGDEDGYVIPTAHVRALLDGKETTFAVRGSLAEWESKASSAPAAGKAAGPDPGPEREHPKGIRVAGHVWKLIVDDENDRIVALIPAVNSVVSASISRRKVLRSVITGSSPTDVQTPVRSDIAWVGHAGSQSLVKVELEEGKVYDRVNVTTGFNHFVASRNHIWTFGGATDSAVVSLKDKVVTLSPMRFGALTYDRRKDSVIGLSLNLGGSKMVELDPDKVGPLIRDVMEIKADAGHSRRKELPDLTKELDSRIKKFTPPAECAELMVKGYRILMVADRSPNLYIGRSVVKRDRLDTVLGTYAAVPFENRNGIGVADAFNTFGEAPAFIHSGSPNGKWVATGTHIFSTETLAVHKELPIPSPTAAFSSDSKTLYIYDLSTQSIIPVDVE